MRAKNENNQRFIPHFRSEELLGTQVKTEMSEISTMGWRLE